MLGASKRAANAIRKFGDDIAVGTLPAVQLYIRQKPRLEYHLTSHPPGAIAGILCLAPMPSGCDVSNYGEDANFPLGWPVADRSLVQGPDYGSWSSRHAAKPPGANSILACKAVAQCASTSRLTSRWPWPYPTITGNSYPAEQPGLGSKRQMRLVWCEDFLPVPSLSCRSYTGQTCSKRWNRGSLFLAGR